MAATIKTLVSKKKQRYVEDGYNLDLSYITDRVIAMGFPAEKFESLYRNSLDEVKKFLDDKHADHYMIYNLCSEKIYDKAKFHGRVQCYPFDDHHPPNFSLIGPFCEDVHAWLSKDERNVAAVHCKAGKGRTGVMICCYLLYSRFASDAQAVLDYYGQKRTMDEKGVTIPSQRRYIHYYDRHLRSRQPYKTVKLYLRTIVLDPVPAFKNIGIANDCLLSFVISQRRRPTSYESPWYVVKRVERQVRLEVNPPLLISDDVKIEFVTKPKLDFVGVNTKIWSKSSKEFHFWLNTFFVDSEMSGGLAHDILVEDNSSSSTSTLSHSTDNNNAESEPTTASVSGDNHPQSNPFFNVSLPNQRTLQDIDVNKGTEVGVNVNVNHHDPEDEDRPNFIEMVRRMSEQGTFESPVITVESEDLTPAAHHQTVVSMASLMPGSHNLASVTEMMRTYSLRNPDVKNGDEPMTSASSTSVHQQNVVHVSEISNASSSSSSSVSLTSAAAASMSTSTAAPLSVPNSSFIDKRTRHASVPQTSSSPGAMSHLLPHPNGSSSGGGKKQGHSSGHSLRSGSLACGPGSAASPITIDGTNISLRLNKSQIDGAAKDKHSRTFSDKFHVILFFTKPTDQSDGLVDYSLQEASGVGSGGGGIGQHNITVTPVAEGQKNPGKKKSKGLKRSEHKSRMSLMHFGRKPDLSSDEEADPDVERLHAITFDERLSIDFRGRDGSHHRTGEGLATDNGKLHFRTRGTSSATTTITSQSDWI